MAFSNYQQQMQLDKPLDHQEQVKVVIRLKPFEAEPLNYKCVYLSEQDNQLVVETAGKKEIFVFDNIARESASQRDIYRMIGEQAVDRSLEGYNCCIFAYGQTGAGKTYSVMGDIDELQNNCFSESRGLIPRIVEDIFNRVANQQHQKSSVTCSYMEIYNQQIFDLLSLDKRIHQLREDKRGVFVEGLNQRKLQSYMEGIETILEGEKTKTIAATTMNAESSRSHVIFTISIQSESLQQDKVTLRKSKLHIVDLAGSERIKHTLVEGDRLKEGCNINKSLHVLGNVINSLVESAKKKKHIPFRDSKLTYFLKDSLGGNSITKLLANVHCGKRYYGDTLSTLMFAKRAKILKMKVEVNQKLTQNFDHLRKEVKKLREQLADTRYFKESKQKSEVASSQHDFQLAYQRISDHIELQSLPKDQTLATLEQNQQHYKALIEIYQEHGKVCEKKQKLNMVKEWKNMQKRNRALTALIRNIPAFTTIYKENLLLKQTKNRPIEDTAPTLKVPSRQRSQTTQFSLWQPEPTARDGTEQIIQYYESLVGEMSIRFGQCLQKLQRDYIDLERLCKFKDQKIKELVRKEGFPPDIEELKNQNEYLQLNILNLENQIAKLQANQLQLQRKDSKRSRNRSGIQQRTHNSLENEEWEQQYSVILQKLIQIKEEAIKQAQLAEKERSDMERVLYQAKVQLNSSIEQNRKLKIRYNRSRSRRRSSGKDSNGFLGDSAAKQSCKELTVPNSSCVPPHQSKVYYDSQAKNLKPSLTKQALALKILVKTQQKQILDLHQQVEGFMRSDRQIEEQFGKDIEEIIFQYREMTRKPFSTLSGSMKNINAWGDTLVKTPKVEGSLLEKIELKISLDGRITKAKDSYKIMKESNKLKNKSSKEQFK